MSDEYPRSIEPVIAIVLGSMEWKSAEVHEVTVKEERSTKSDDNTKRRLQCRTAPKILDVAESRDAQFVMASLFWSGTTRDEPPFVPRSASIASELGGQVTGIGCPGSASP
jgi:hypothetical protein